MTFQVGDQIELLHKASVFSRWRGVKGRIEAPARYPGYWMVYFPVVPEGRPTPTYSISEHDMRVDVPLTPFLQAVRDYINSELT